MPSSCWQRTAVAGARAVKGRSQPRIRSAGDSTRPGRIISRCNHDTSPTKGVAAQPRERLYCSKVPDPIPMGDDECQSSDENMDGERSETACPDVKVLQYKVENEHLKKLLRKRSHDLREECSALSLCQTELAEALISQTADDNCVKGRQIQKLARDLRDRLCLSEMQMKMMREERDQAALDLTALSGKMTSCTAIAEEQGNLLKGQLETIRKFGKKTHNLEKALQETRTLHKETVHEFESRMGEMRIKHKEKFQDYEKRLQDSKGIHSEEVQILENSMREMREENQKEIQALKKSIHEIRAGYKEERAALEEQVGLHQQRAALQDRKIKKYQNELENCRSGLLEARAREAEMEEQLHIQTKVCKETTKELAAATTEIEHLNCVSAELHEQEERMEQLWVDNARLVQLLAESEEYQSLFSDMQAGKGLVFCPSQFKTSRFRNLAQRYGAGASYGPIDPKRERKQWIPVELYDLAMAFRKQYFAGLESETVREFLGMVTAFWRERHKKIMSWQHNTAAHESQVKLKYEKTLTDLRRQLSHRLPYGQVVQAFRKPAKRSIDLEGKSLKSSLPATRVSNLELETVARDETEFLGSAPRAREIMKARAAIYGTRQAVDSLDLHSFKKELAYKKHRGGGSPLEKRMEKSVRVSPRSYQSRKDTDDDRWGASARKRNEASADEQELHTKREKAAARKFRSSFDDPEIHSKHEAGYRGIRSEVHKRGIINEVIHRERANRHREQDELNTAFSNADEQEDIPLFFKKSKTKCFPSFTAGLCLGREQTEETVSPSRSRITSSPIRERSRNIPSSPESSTEGAVLRRRSVEIKAERDGNRRRRSFSRSSSV